MRPLVFRPTESESIYIDDNKIGWSNYCHSNLSRDMKNQKYYALSKFEMPLVMILIGTLILLIGISNVFSPYVVIACYIFSIASISFGIFSFIGGLKHGRV